MKNFKQLFITLSLLLAVAFSANAGQTVVETTDLGEDKTSGIVRIVMTLTDAFVSNTEGRNTDVGIIAHQADFTGWNDGIALCMFQLVADTVIELKGYNASTWGTEEIVNIERNKQVALWLSYDAGMDTHSLSYQIQGETATTVLYTDYGNRALPRDKSNDFSRFCTVAFNNNFTAEGCVVINDAAKFVDAIEPFTFEVGAALTENQFNANISIYPTLVKNELSIISEKSLTSVSIITLNGQELISAINTNTLDVTNLSAGMYLVKAISINGEVAIRKIIKE